MPQPCGVSFWSYKDPTTDLTREVMAAFQQRGVTASVPALRALDADTARRSSPYRVPVAELNRTLLADDADAWRLAVRHGDTVEVLARADLEQALEAHDSTDELLVPLLAASEQDQRILDASKAYLSPENSLKRIEDAVNAPVALIATVATFAGLCGLLAVDDKIQREWLVGVSLVASILAVGLSLFGRYGLKPLTLKLNRLDLLVKTFDGLQQQPRIAAARFGVFLLVVGLAAAAGAVFPKKTHPATASISVPSGGKDNAGAEVQVKVSWTDLPAAATGARVVVRQANNEIYERTMTAASGKAEHTYDVELPGTADFTVETQAIKSKDETIGMGFLRSFSVP